MTLNAPVAADTPHHTPRPPVTLSRWVNEPCPPWNELLSARDVARLTRRHKWVVLGLSWCGLFPRQRTFRGCKVGWLKADVIAAMTQDLHTRECRASMGAQSARKKHPRQGCLPLECRMPCSTVRHGRARRSRDNRGLGG